MPDQTTAVPLPEPVAHFIDCAAPGQPAEWKQAASLYFGQPGVVPFFTSAQLLDYGDRRAAEERERCALACEALTKCAVPDEYDQAAIDCAEAIMKGA